SLCGASTLASGSCRCSGPFNRPILSACGGRDAGQIEDDVGAAVAVVGESDALGAVALGQAADGAPAHPAAGWARRVPRPPAVSAAGDADPRCIPDTDRR